MVKYEELIDRFMNTMDPDGHLWEIGFHNSGEILQSTKLTDDIFYMDTSEKINGEGPNAEDSIHFLFVFMGDSQSERASLVMIKAFLETTSPASPLVKEATETVFYPLNGQFPQKCSMVMDVLSKLSLPNDK